MDRMDTTANGPRWSTSTAATNASTRSRTPLSKLARDELKRGNKRQDSQIVTVTADDHTFQLDIDGQTVATVPRTSGREIHRYNGYATQPPRHPR